jgi:hypothetical protein
MSTELSRPTQGVVAVEFCDDVTCSLPEEGYEARRPGSRLEFEHGISEIQRSSADVIGRLQHVLDLAFETKLRQIQSK